MFTKSFTSFTNSSEAKPMSALAECSQMFRVIARDQPVRGGRVKAALREIRAALPGWSESRVRSVWYEDERVCITGDELRQVERAARAAANEKAAKNEFQLMQQRIARLEALLVQGDEDFHRPQADALRELAGLPDRTVGRRD